MLDNSPCGSLPCSLCETSLRIQQSRPGSKLDSKFHKNSTRRNGDAIERRCVWRIIGRFSFESWNGNKSLRRCNCKGRENVIRSIPGYSFRSFGKWGKKLKARHVVWFHLLDPLRCASTVIASRDMRFQVKHKARRKYILVLFDAAVSTPRESMEMQETARSETLSAPTLVDPKIKCASARLASRLRLKIMLINSYTVITTAFTPKSNKTAHAVGLKYDKQMDKRQQ